MDFGRNCVGCEQGATVAVMVGKFPLWMCTDHSRELRRALFDLQTVGRVPYEGEDQFCYHTWEEVWDAMEAPEEADEPEPNPEPVIDER